MSKRLQVYRGDDVTVTFDPNICIHSAVCLRTLPAVFDVNRARWIAVEKASADEVVAAVARCPSGALQAQRAGAGSTGPGTEPVEVTVRPNGPLLVRGRIRVERESGEIVEKESCAFCRCGATKNAPFCDGSHEVIRFRSPS
jgi:uncharacterized Fe-S cluster protein YjdI